MNKQVLVSLTALIIVGCSDDNIGMGGTVAHCKYDFARQLNTSSKNITINKMDFSVSESDPKKNILKGKFDVDGVNHYTFTCTVEGDSYETAKASSILIQSP